MEKIELTRAEIDALNKHNEKVRSETIKTVFDAVEELLEANKKLEHNRAEMSQSYVGDQMHKYAERLCATLLADLSIIRERCEVAEYNEAARECKEGVNNGFSSSVTDPKGDKR